VTGSLLSQGLPLIDVLRRAGSYSQLKRKYPADDPRVVEAHQELVAARLLAHVSDIMSTSPPLGSDQVERIARLLRRDQ
jgi:hypothetical protein